MATIKSFTDIEQSKKLAKILPIESADMYYSPVPVRRWKDKEDKSKGTHVIFQDQIFALENLPTAQIGEGDTYAWSLAALLSVLPDYTLQTNTDGTVFVVCDSKKPMISDSYNNPVDACVAMMLKLHELNLL